MKRILSVLLIVLAVLVYGAIKVAAPAKHPALATQPTACTPELTVVLNGSSPVATESQITRSVSPGTVGFDTLIIDATASCGNVTITSAEYHVVVSGTAKPSSSTTYFLNGRLLADTNTVVMGPVDVGPFNVSGNESTAKFSLADSWTIAGDTRRTLVFMMDVSPALNGLVGDQIKVIVDNITTAQGVKVNIEPISTGPITVIAG